MANADCATCPQCGAPISTDGPAGLCPRCLLDETQVGQSKDSPVSLSLSQGARVKRGLSRASALAAIAAIVSVGL